MKFRELRIGTRYVVTEVPEGEAQILKGDNGVCKDRNGKKVLILIYRGKVDQDSSADYSFKIDSSFYRSKAYRLRKELSHIERSLGDKET